MHLLRPLCCGLPAEGADTGAGAAAGAELASLHRLLLLRSHYRATLDFTDAQLAETRRELDRFYRALQAAKPTAKAEIPAEMLEALCDDLNTPLAISLLHGLADAAMAGDAKAGAEMVAAGAVLGILQQDPDAWFQGEGDDAAAIEAAIAERIAARKSRDFARADAIRKALTDQGILLEDNATGTTWRRA